MPEYEVTIIQTRVNRLQVRVLAANPEDAERRIRERLTRHDDHVGNGKPTYHFELIEELPNSGVGSVPTSLSLTVIPAEVHSDDFHVQVKFDAVAWFKGATDKQLMELAESDWGGDYPADDVARFFSGLMTKPVFDYLATRPTAPNGDTVGFECHVDPKAAAAWLRRFRPSVWVRIAKEIVDA